MFFISRCQVVYGQLNAVDQALSNFGDSDAGVKMFRKNENRAELYVAIQGATFEVRSLCRVTRVPSGTGRYPR